MDVFLIITGYRILLDHTSKLRKQELDFEQQTELFNDRNEDRWQKTALFYGSNIITKI